MKTPRGNDLKVNKQPPEIFIGFKVNGDLRVCLFPPRGNYVTKSEIKIRGGYVVIRLP